ncbi:MAG TPA: pirin family protein [Flavobacteriales bacterium]|nr:pirin family protein [Flavobacteriales bacterium]
MSENKIRSVRALLYAQEYPMGKLRVRQPFPSHQVDYPDPFLLLHHANMEIPKTESLADAGVGPHPHRGFSPVTFIFKGGVHHRDSRGNNSIIYEGGVQWMNSGMGIIHSERPPFDIHERGSRQEIIQMWVNTPAANKMDQPEYHPVSAEETPQFETPDQLITAYVVTGKLFGLKGPVPTATEVNSATIEATKGGRISIEIPDTHEAFLYLLDGKISLENYGLAEMHQAVLFNKDGNTISFEALENTRMLFMSGKPLNEPMASHGPFVMTNETELLQAMRDYQMGKMGVLIEE